MPGLELHSDFDRDGRLTGSPQERAARSSWPGAVVIPNMDRDRRRLPVSVGNASMGSPDYDLVATFSGDNELLPVEVRAAAGALRPGDTLHLRCSGVMHSRVKLSDDTGRIVPHRLRQPEHYELPTMPANGVMPLTLQVRTIAGAAWGRVSNVNRNYKADANEEGRFILTLLRRDGTGVEHVEDQGRFSVAPFILADRTAAARRLYMVKSTTNVPSLHDVRIASRLARVPLIEIDDSLTGGDTWIQDQYQHSLMQGPHGWSELILHLPRLRRENTTATITDNLEDVVNTHFQSRDVGLFGDLWDRQVPVQTADGGVVRPSFRDLDSWVKHANRVWSAHEIISLYAEDADRSWRRRTITDWVDALLRLDSELQRALQAIQAARSGASHQRDRQLADEKTVATDLVRQVKRQFPVGQPRSSDPIIESDLSGQRTRLKASVLRKLYERAFQMHASYNYGGNIESTPPVAGAPLGKIILGNGIDTDDNEAVDPDLLKVLAKQKKQPVVEVDTIWLKVGHVDEILSVVPSRRAQGGFVIFAASSKAAVELLKQARARYLAGLPMEHPDRVTAGRRPSGVMTRLMTAGTSPVTRLMRGKAWLHQQERPTGGVLPPSIEPPSIYFHLCQAYGTSTADTGFNRHGIGYVPGLGDNRRYPADITPNELLWAETDKDGGSCNVVYDETVLRNARNTLTGAFPSIELLPIPVILDRTHDLRQFRDNPWSRPTTAFTPDMVNMQILNDHLLVPKPYGPRMKIDDAIAVVREAMTAVEMPGPIKSRVGRRLIASRRMTRGEYWVEKVRPAYLTSSIGTIRASYGGMWSKSDVVSVFKDSFPGANAAELERRIVRPNGRRFDSDGVLREDFSLFRIEDGMVDIFELYVAAVAAELGVRLHFVDSWSYHLYEGQIHCGTNVLRGHPPLGSGLPDVWDAPDHNFRGTVAFSDEPVVSGTGSQP